MESIIARALEYTLKYWLKSFSRDQFKLQGRTAQLSNLDINGDALHSSLGLPPAINVATAKVGKLEISLPSVSMVQVEPIVVQIDRLDLVLEENADTDTCPSSSSAQSTSSSGRGSGYGYADKIADGMTIEVQTVNLLLETRGAGRQQGGATWTPPMASITIRNLLLYTTNEEWEVVNLKEARDFSTNKEFIYVFKKLEWGSLSIDLLPHPDMFMDVRVQEGVNKRDDDGAKRSFFGGERFLEGISGQAYITVQRTHLNDPLGLEARLHISEAVCPALSEPGLRAFLRFLTGLYVCLNRGDVDPKSQQRSTEAAGRSLISFIVDHVFLCIRDTEFRLELLMQSLCFTRASIANAENAKNLTQIMIGGFFLRDTFSRPPCTLIQPSMETLTTEFQEIPDFAKDFCPPIYPLGDKHWPANMTAPFISIHSLQVTPSPAPPLFASQTVIGCQPIMIYLHEDSCLRICSFLADGIVGNASSVLPDFSINSLLFNLRELDLTVPLHNVKSTNHACSDSNPFGHLFDGARLLIENLFLFESPSLRLSMLELEKDPACFCLWHGQPIDAGQKKWSAGASALTLSLEKTPKVDGKLNSSDSTSRSWRCVDMKKACIEVAMATPDGSPLVCIPPPDGVVRMGIAFEQCCSSSSVDQLFFVLDLCSYFGEVSEKIALVGKSTKLAIPRTDSWSDQLMSNVPSDTAVSFSVMDLQLRFLDDSCKSSQGKILVQFVGEDLFSKVSHRTLGGAIAISSTIRWQAVEIDCLDAESNSIHGNDTMLNGSLLTANRYPQLRAVLWVHHKGKKRSSGTKMNVPFLDVSIVHVIPSQTQDTGCHSLNVSACVAGVRLAGGMNYAEALLHQFGILGPDGGPSEGLLKGLENFSSGPLSKVFKSSPLAANNVKENGNCQDEHDSFISQLGMPDDVDVSVDLRNWLFALEGAQEVGENIRLDDHHADRENRCWHTTFESLKIKAKNTPKDVLPNGLKCNNVRKYPVDLITIGVEGLQTLKPQLQTAIHQTDFPVNGLWKADTKEEGGINFEVQMVASEEHCHDEPDNWIIENLKFSVEQPIEAVVTKSELQHLAFLCKSEVDSIGRVSAVVLRLLKLEGSIGQSAIDQLNNLGSEGLVKFFDRKTSERTTSALEHSVSSNGNSESPCSSLTTIVASLDKEVEDTKSKCASLISSLGESEPSSQYLDRVKELGQQIESIESLLKQLKTQG
ncbi:uncharacterized protein LOC141646917 isoform X1 [Silene latifolia]|uniref:uncharacterized protein LOC141646917 isoform X1 n=2 Tax=Silene latifolia TaxID=37657 RepID=UPI003D77B8E2